MPLLDAKCPNCGAQLKVDPSTKAAICPKCNSAFVVEEAINNYNTTNNVHIENMNVDPDSFKAMNEYAAYMLEEKKKKDEEQKRREEEKKRIEEQQRIQRQKEEEKERTKKAVKGVFIGLGVGLIIMFILLVVIGIACSNFVLVGVGGIGLLIPIVILIIYFKLVS